MITIESATKRYGELAVVEDVSLTVERGEIAVIVGTSGSGKTTLMRMVNRLVEPTSGRILVAGRDNRELPVHELRRRIGYAIQGHGLFPHRTVAQNVATVPTLLGWDQARVSARVDHLLELFQLEPGKFRDRMPYELSGGQQQRVGVARALAAEPDVLLMDEPYGALDPVIRAKAQQDLLAIQRQLSTTILLVTHDMEEATLLGSRIAVMDKGRLVQYATPREILQNPASDFVRALIGEGERPFRLLGLTSVGAVMEPGAAEGAPISAEASLREALAEALWTGRDALPVARGGVVVGRVTRSTLEAQARAR
jgi:osmoprotectant transport system ATP-binding protein